MCEGYSHVKCTHEIHWLSKLSETESGFVSVC